VRGLDAPSCKPRCYAPDFLDRPADEVRVCGIRLAWVFFGVTATVLALLRMIAIMAKASITSETWRCHPCQDRVSL
jgi:hypothetical protein